MQSKVFLKIINGVKKGEGFSYIEPSTVLIGRSPECNIVLPNDEAHVDVSRFHCILDIIPPKIKIKDFGSLNGTFVNGKNIGQRAPDQNPEEGAELRLSEYDLKDNDLIKIGETQFSVNIPILFKCTECRKEIKEPEKLKNKNICLDCEKKIDMFLEKKIEEKKIARKALLNKYRPPKPSPVIPNIKKKIHCKKCGKDITQEKSIVNNKLQICNICRQKPVVLLQVLLEQANKGNQMLKDIAGYKVIKELGRGGMGAVYLVKDEKRKKDVALKIMLPKIEVNQSARDMFMREVQLGAMLSHHHVVRVYDTGNSNGTMYMTTEYCQGGSVDVLMKKYGGKLSLDRAAGIITHSLRGLEYIHRSKLVDVLLKDGRKVSSRGLVHRDLKPANIFLSDDSPTALAKIADVGMSKAFQLAGMSGFTRTGNTAGSPLFMPRQQVINFKYAKPEVDIWAIAASFYNMVTGTYPRDFQPGKDIWLSLLKTKPVPIRKRDKSIPKPIARVIDSALEDHKALKYKNVKDFEKDFLHALRK